MLLSSVLKIRNHIADQDSDLDSAVQNNSLLMDWLTAVSSRVERYLNRLVEKTSRTQYFDTTFRRINYYPDATPIETVTSVKVASDGRYSGSETTLTTDQYYTGADSKAVVLDWPEWHRTEKGLQLVYTGGLATNAVRSTFVTTVNSGAWTVDKYVIGQTSQAVGIVRDITAAAFIVENLYGIFEAGEIILESDTEIMVGGDVGASDGNSTINSITQQSLAESHPDIVKAVAMQIRYMWTHNMDFENAGTQPDGETRRRAAGAKAELQPEVRDMLNAYRRYVAV